MAKMRIRRKKGDILGERLLEEERAVDWETVYLRSSFMLFLR